MAPATLFARRLALAAPASRPPLCPACQDTGRMADPDGAPLTVPCPECRPSCMACGHPLTGGECFNCGFTPEER